MVKRLASPRDNAALSSAEIAGNFCDLHPPLSLAQAQIEAARCLYCYDAPCIRACPTAIDIPTFIQQIRSGNLLGSGQTILNANILGGTCARACPTEMLCEGACVVNHTEGAPVRIGALQRRAVDTVMAKAQESGAHPFARAKPSGRKFAVIGSGPAGLAFAHRAAMLGHQVKIFERNSKGGGLNEYGLAAYKMADEFAQRELAFVLSVGGIEIQYQAALGESFTLEEVRREFDAVFVGVGLGDAHRLDIPGADLPQVRDALGFIAALRALPDKAAMGIGRRVAVIGGGNTAIDAAMQAKALGAKEVVLLYRRGPMHMGATAWEQELASTNGIMLRCWARPVRIAAALEGQDGVEVTCAETRLEAGKLVDGGAAFTLGADLVLVAIGQGLLGAGLSALRMDGPKIWVDEAGRTSLEKVYAGGDCVARGQDLTVQAVADGLRAALAAHADLALGGK